jgi:hypothetical protein
MKKICICLCIKILSILAVFGVEVLAATDNSILEYRKFCWTDEKKESTRLKEQLLEQYKGDSPNDYTHWLEAECKNALKNDNEPVSKINDYLIKEKAEHAKPLTVQYKNACRTGNEERINALHEKISDTQSYSACLKRRGYDTLSDYACQEELMTMARKLAFTCEDARKGN